MPKGPNRHPAGVGGEGMRADSPGPQVIEQMIANLGLLLIELGEEVQKQGEAAIVFLHLAQVSGGGVYKPLSWLAKPPANILRLTSKPPDLQSQPESPRLPGRRVCVNAMGGR